MMLNHGDLFDGYRLIRQIGSGGFGEVWLCRSEAIGELKALKFVTAARPEMLERELSSLVRYRQATGALRSPHLMPIEHINRTAGGLFYIMPLADGGGAGSPEEAGWRPLTLERMIQERQGEWFSSAEIAAMMAPVLAALQAISDAGLVHRDVKPANILFLGGHPCLADISLLGEDSMSITRRGTPGYIAPSWYVESGGSPDMFGAATTLYTLLTGNPPDKLGRSKFWWPPKGESSLCPEEHAAWKRLHTIIRRAVDEKQSERFIDFRAFADAFSSVAVSNIRRPDLRKWALPSITIILLGAISLIWFKPPPHEKPATSATSGTQVATKAPEAEHETVEGMALFRDSIATFDKEINKLRDWYHTYDKEFRKELMVLNDNMLAFSKSTFGTYENRVKAFKDINTGFDTLLKLKPEFPPEVVYQKLGQKFEALQAEVFIQAKTSADRAYFFEHVKPALVDKFKESFDGLSPGHTRVAWGRTMIMNKYNSEVYKKRKDLLPFSDDPMKTMGEEAAVAKEIEKKISLLYGY